jgi:sugar lactone lactonase YvrE
VLVYNASTPNAQPILTINVGTSYLSGIAGITVDSSGNLWVANELGNTVTGYHPGATTPFITYSSELSFPTAVAAAQDGTIYVSNAPSGAMSRRSWSVTMP